MSPREPASVSSPEPSASASESFYEQVRERLGETRIRKPGSREQPPTPPRGVFDLVHYSAPVGELPAYVSPVRPGQKRPAIVWIHGGFDWGIGSFAWEAAPRDNDQSAAAFREAGMVLMLPALRGTSGGPGESECFLGEVDDVLAAREYLLTREDVDPQRIYLGGHSTGGTMVLLAAAASDDFRAVFALGPAANPISYGEYGCLPREVDADELLARNPSVFVRHIRTPTYVVEGESGNALDLVVLEKLRDRAPVEIVLVPGAGHFDIIRPLSEYIAGEIMAGRDETSFDAAKLIRAATAR